MLPVIRFKHKHIIKQHLLEVKYGTELIPNHTLLKDLLIYCDKMDLYRNKSNIYIENTKEKIDIDNPSVEESDLAELLEEIKQIISDTDSQYRIQDDLEEEETNNLLEEINQILNEGFNKTSSQKSLYVENDLLEKPTIEDSEVNVDLECEYSNQVLDLTIDEKLSEKSLELEIIEENNVHNLVEEVDMDLESEHSNEVVDLTIEDIFLEEETHRQEEHILQNQVFQKDSESINETAERMQLETSYVDEGRLEFSNCLENNMCTTKINEDLSSCHFENVTSNLDDEKLTTCKSISDKCNNFTYQNTLLNVSSEEKDLWDLLEEIKVQEEKELSTFVKSDFKNHQTTYDIDTFQQPKEFSSEIIDLTINETFCLEGKGNVTESSISTFNLDSKMQNSSVQMLDAINVDNDSNSPKKNQIKISEKLATESLRTNCEETVLNKTDECNTNTNKSSKLLECIDESSKFCLTINESTEGTINISPGIECLISFEDEDSGIVTGNLIDKTSKDAQVKQNNNLAVEGIPSDDVDLAVKVVNKELFESNSSELILICDDNQPYNKTNSSDYTLANKNLENNHCDIKEQNNVTGNVIYDTQNSTMKSIPTINIDSDILKDNYSENISNNDVSLQSQNTETIQKCKITNFEMFNECFQIIDELETINLEIEENLKESTNIEENMCVTDTYQKASYIENKNTREPKNMCNIPVDLKLKDNKIHRPDTNKENLIGKVKDHKDSNSTTKKIAKEILNKPYKCRSCLKRSFKERPDAISHIISKHGKASVQSLLFKMEDIVTNNIESNKNIEKNKRLINKNDTITNQKEKATNNLKSRTTNTSPVQLKGSKRKCENDPTELGEVAKRPCLDRDSSRKIETIISSGTSSNITQTLTPDLKLNSGLLSSVKSSSELDIPKAASLSTDKNSGPNSVLNIKNQKNSSKIYKYTPPILIGQWGKNQSPRFPKISPYFWPFGKKS